MAPLSERERIEILIMVGYGDRQRTHAEACELFNHEHPDRPPINRSTVTKLVVKFTETGSVKDRPRQGRPQVGEHVKLNVLLEAEERHHVSTRQLALANQVAHSFVVKLFKKEHYCPYKVKLVQELHEGDEDRRLQFCEDVMLRCDQNPNFLENIVFTDEATFCLNGSVHPHNCRYWSQNNPHWTRACHTQRRGKVNVWVGMIGRRILGPYFF